MGSSASISGLASGLDTSTIISQLMQLEAAPQTRLKNQVGTEEKAVASLQGLNAKVAALRTKAEELAKPESWTSVAAKTSTSAVSVTTAPGATATSLGFTVESVAAAHQVLYTERHALADAVVPAGSTITLTRPDGTTSDITATDGTLTGLVSAINGSGSGLRAAAVQVSTGQYQLRVESTATGYAGGFSLSVGGQPLLGTEEVVSQGADSVLRLSPSTTVASSSATFTDLLPGVNVTVGADTPLITAIRVDLTIDSSAMAGKVKGLVDALNGVLGDIDAATQTATGGTKAGLLAGDSTLRSVRDALVQSIYPSAGGSLASAGVQVDKYGKLAFDEAVFSAAYTKDPAGTATRFTAATSTTGFADRLAAAAKAASDSRDGTLTTAINGRKTTIDRLNGSIEDWDRRLELRQETLKRQYSALETALNRMNSQSSWLAGQIASLPSYQSSSD